jgi:hypothetical protein
MKNVINFLKKSYDLAKGWVVSNGITGIAGLVAGLGLWAFGYKIWAGVAFGVFATRNWDIFVEWVKSIIKK